MKKKTVAKKKKIVRDKNYFEQFIGITKGGKNPLDELMKEKKWEIEHDRKKFGI